MAKTRDRGRIIRPEVGMATCPICWNTATASELRSPDGGIRAAKRFDCEICGHFEVTDHQEVNGRSLSADQRYLLSAVTRNATEEGRVVDLDTESATRLLDTPWPSATEQETLFLAYVERKAKRRGDAVPVSHKRDYPLFFAKGEEEVNFIARELSAAGFIKRTDVSAVPQYALTRNGHVELEQRRAKPATPQTPSRPPDPVTGLLNRGAFDADLAAAVTMATAETPLAFVMVDVDHFKKVNDTYGHPKGDEVLWGIAQRLQSVTAGKGTAYRYGGEEMAILLPNHSLHEALPIAERARVSVEQSPVAGVPVTISLGAAVLPDHAADHAALVTVADAAMYDAKNRGRNLVRYHGAPEPATDRTTHAPPIKQPEPNAVSDEWKRSAQVAHFGGKAVRCPRDGAILEAQRDNQIGMVGGVYFFCQLCGLDVQVEGRSLP